MSKMLILYGIGCALVAAWGYCFGMIMESRRRDRKVRDLLDNIDKSKTVWSDRDKIDSIDKWA